MKEKWRKTPADGSRHSFSVLRPECFFFLFTSPRRCTPQCTPVPRKKAGKKYNCPISLRISERRGFGGGVPKRNHCAGAPDKNKKFCFPAEAEPLFPRAWYNSAGKRNWEPPRGGSRRPRARTARVTHVLPRRKKRFQRRPKQKYCFYRRHRADAGHRQRLPRASPLRAGLTGRAATIAFLSGCAWPRWWNGQRGPRAGRRGIAKASDAILCRTGCGRRREKGTGRFWLG
jgi:hypothetical protein